MEVAGAPIDEIQFRDVERGSLSGWLGIIIHLLIVPIIFLGCFIFYALGGWGASTWWIFTTCHCHTLVCNVEFICRD